MVRVAAPGRARGGGGGGEEKSGIGWGFLHLPKKLHKADNA